MTEPFVVDREAAEGPWRVLAAGDRTDGQVIFGEALLPPMTPGPSLHVHTREDEAAYVIDGVLTVQIGDRRLDAGPGTLVWLPRNEPHTFASLSSGTPVRVFGITTPAGLEGMFREQARYFAGLEGPPDEAHIAEIGRRYGVTVVGPGLL